MKKIRKIVLVFTIFFSLLLLSSCGIKKKSSIINGGYGNYEKIETVSSRNRSEEILYNWHGGEGFKPSSKTIISWSADYDSISKEYYRWDLEKEKWIGISKEETIYTKSKTSDKEYISKRIYYKWNLEEDKWEEIKEEANTY